MIDTSNNRISVEEPATTEGKWKRRRRTQPVARTIKAKDMRPSYDVPEQVLETRPVTRADCVDGPRPCPWVSCRANLYLDVNPINGSIKLNFPNLEPHELEHSCSLDQADSGPVSLEIVALRLNVSRERASGILDDLALPAMRRSKVLR